MVLPENSTKNIQYNNFFLPQTAVMKVSANNPSLSNFTSGAASRELQIKQPVENITWFNAIGFCVEGLGEAFMNP